MKSVYRKGLFGVNVVFCPFAITTPIRRKNSRHRFALPQYRDSYVLGIKKEADLWDKFNYEQYKLRVEMIENQSYGDEKVKKKFLELKKKFDKARKNFDAAKEKALVEFGIPIRVLEMELISVRSIIRTSRKDSLKKRVLLYRTEALKNIGLRTFFHITRILLSMKEYEAVIMLLRDSVSNRETSEIISAVKLYADESEACSAILGNANLE